MEKFRDRKFCLLLYPDCAEHVQALEKIKASYDYACILHDKDVLEDTGEVKKAHWHVVLISGKNAIWSSALSKELGLDGNYIQQCRNIDRALEYLIHFNEEEKHQYSIEEVTGTLNSRLNQLINCTNKTESDKVSELIEFIESYQGYLTISVFSKHCASVGMWDVFRRAGTIFIKIIEEHNQRHTPTTGEIASGN